MLNPVYDAFVESPAPHPLNPMLGNKKKRGEKGNAAVRISEEEQKRQQRLQEQELISLQPLGCWDVDFSLNCGFSLEERMHAEGRRTKELQKGE